MRYSSSESKPSGPYFAYLAILRLWYVGEVLLESIHVGSEEIAENQLRGIKEYFSFVSRFTQACFFATVKNITREQKQVRDRGTMKMVMFLKKLREAENFDDINSAKCCSYRARDDILDVMRKEARASNNIDISLERMAETMMESNDGETSVLFLARYARRTKFAQRFWALRIMSEANVHYKVCGKMRAPFRAIRQLRNATKIIEDRNSFVFKYLSAMHVKSAFEWIRS